VNCLTGDALVSADGITGGFERLYEGMLVVLETSAGNKLSATPNHPVLTPRGWIGAGSLHVGDHVICQGIGEMGIGLNPKHQNVPAMLHQVVGALGSRDEMVSVSVPTAPEDFHGDGFGSKVAVVWANGELLHNGDAAGQHHGGKLVLGNTNVRGPHLPGLGPLLSFGHRDSPANHGLVGGSVLGGPFARRHPGPLSQLGFMPTAYANTRGDQSPADGPAIALQALRDGVLGFAGKVTTDYLVSIEFRPSWSGHVYNLQTAPGWYVANHYITSNCRCWLDTTTEI
jgi:hypothetical protein